MVHMGQPNESEADAALREAMEFAELQKKEYGTWVATEDIPHGNVYAYRKGDPVPISNVEKWGYDKRGQVARVVPEEDATVQGATGTTRTKGGKG